MSWLTKLLDVGKVILLGLFIMGMGLTPAHADKTNVIATISIIGDVVKNVAGDQLGGCRDNE